MDLHHSLLAQMTGRVLKVLPILFLVAASSSATNFTSSSVEMAPSPTTSQSTAIYSTVSPSRSTATTDTTTRAPAQTSRVVIVPSPSQSTPVTRTRFTEESSRTLSQSIAVESTVESVYPTKTPEPHHTCHTGPDFEHKGNTLIVTDRIYLDLSEPVNCTGVITRWHYCFIVIAFRKIRAGLWPCVWRKSNSSEDGYDNVGCNKFTIIPGDGDDVRCKYYSPSNPSEFLRVEEGDYIGFYIPDSGLIPALSASESHTHHYQLERNETGFSSFINESELINATSSPGRALLRAEIDSDWVPPSVMPTTPIVTTAEPTTQPSSLPNTALAASLVVAVGLTIVLIITVIALVAYVNRRHRCCSGYDGLQGGANDMDYNDIYRFRSANHVVVGNRRTFVKLSENPAYESTSPTSLVPPRRPDWSVQGAAEACSSTPSRRQLEHTYESLSNYNVHATKNTNS